jgi:hypothetical protein
MCERAHTRSDGATRPRDFAVRDISGRSAAAPGLSVLPSLVVGAGNADPFSYPGNAAYGLGSSALPAFEFVPHVLPLAHGRLRPGAAAAAMATRLRSGAGGRRALWAHRALLGGPADPTARVWSIGITILGHAAVLAYFL